MIVLNLEMTDRKDVALHPRFYIAHADNRSVETVFRDTHAWEITQGCNVA